MRLEELNAKVRAWDFQYTGVAEAKSKYGIILAQLYYHARQEWRVYSPAAHLDFNQNYMERLAAWIGNVSDEADQKLLLEYALHISFFSSEDFMALYRTALDREVTRWVASQIRARLDTGGGQAFHDQVHQQVHRHTWFCPVTDSMTINEFHKVNHLSGVSVHPDFKTLQMSAEDPGNPDPQVATRWIRYMSNPSGDPLRPSPPLERLVLLEDIVGSSSQCLKPIRWAVKSLGKPVLFVPLILCPNGVDALRTEEQQSNGMLTVRPVIELRRGDLVGPERKGEAGWSIAIQLEHFARKCKEKRRVTGNPFGFKSTGCSLSKFSNCPNNTIPLVHQTRTGEWNALFPRIPR